MNFSPLAEPQGKPPCSTIRVGMGLLGFLPSFLNYNYRRSILVTVLCKISDSNINQHTSYHHEKSKHSLTWKIIKILLNAYIILHNRKIKQYYFQIVLTLISASVMGHFCLHLSKSLWNELTKAIFILNCRNGESQNTLKSQCYLWFQHIHKWIQQLKNGCGEPIYFSYSSIVKL